MKTIRFLLLFVSLLSLASCRNVAKDDGKTKQSSDKAELARQTDSALPATEDFYTFLEEFNTQRIFQLKRIVFPITVSITDGSEIGLTPTEEKIEKRDWELLDLSYDSTYATRDFDKYTQNVYYREDTAHVSLRGIDNGIYADYYFKLIDGEWYLVTLVE